ncbi:MAG: glycosyltransferase family 4 protein [Ardenticatenia bacterium]|nr:glycosyltransferase family 4 protein [Ardenticatenia bacterium]
MHVGMVHYAAPPVVGGVELTIYHHARVLLAEGHRVTVVAGRGEAVLPGLTFRQEPMVDSRHEHVLALQRELSVGRIPAAFESTVEALRLALQRHLEACDVVIGHNFFTLHKNLALTVAVNRLVTAGEGPPWVAWHHDFAWLRPQYRPELHPGEPWDLLRRPWPGVRHVTVSAAQRDDLARLYGLSPDHIAVVPPGVEPLAFFRCDGVIAHLISQWRLFEADCIFLLPARITRRKRIELGLRWLDAVRRASGWDARLIVTGPPGPHNPANAAYLEELLALRHSLNLENAAHFAYLATPDRPLLLQDEHVAALYQVADALLFPSRQEGFGIPVLEAGLGRLPVFAADLPPFRESGGEHVTLFPPEAPPDEVGHTIVHTLQHDRAFQFRRRILRHFTWSTIVRMRLLPLLGEAITTPL